MAFESSLAEPSIELLRSLAAQQGIHAEDVDLEAVLAFLTLIQPALAEIERRLPQELAP